MRFLFILFVLGFVYWPMPARAADATWSISIVGDMMFDRHVRTLLKTQSISSLMAPIRSQLASDFLIGNLEGPITPNRSIATDTKLLFTFDLSVAKQLRQAGFSAVSLANNHTLNFGQRGLDQTRSALRQEGITYAGDPRNRSGYGVVRTIKGVRVAMLGYHGLVSGLEQILSDVRTAKTRADIIIVMPHGGTEYQRTFSRRQQQDYRKLIDAGADLVVGAHPHVVQPLEVYKGKLIAYSLGNFIFDQYFSAETQQGLALMVKGEGKNIRRVELIPTQSQRSVVSPASAYSRSLLLKRLQLTSVLGPKNTQHILRGYILL